MTQTNSIVSRYNPESIAKPVGEYSHVTKISRNAELYVFLAKLESIQAIIFPLISTNK